MNQRKIEVFVAGCPVCEDTVKLVKSIACPSCNIQILDMSTNKDAQNRAKKYGIKRVPTVVIEGKISDCCQQNAVDEKTLRQLGVGVSL